MCKKEKIICVYYKVVILKCRNCYNYQHRFLNRNKGNNNL